MINARYSRVFGPEPEQPTQYVELVDYSSGGTTNVVNLTGGERGILKTINIVNGETVTGTPDVTLRIVIDGGTPLDIPFYDGGSSVQEEMLVYLAFLSALGAQGALSVYAIPLYLPFSVSCVVSVIVGDTSDGEATFTAIVGQP